MKVSTAKRILKNYNITAIVLGAIFILSFLFLMLGGIFLQEWKTNPASLYATPASLYVTNFDDYTIKWNPGTNFLTITNLVYVRMEESVIVRVTDAQWQTITNHYADKLETNNISFYK